MAFRRLLCYPDACLASMACVKSWMAESSVKAAERNVTHYVSVLKCTYYRAMFYWLADA